jgi:alkanesulfonate monooxygenase SsuD/methylene tetrahydromethanopterin reductase-like flavin-dependent oxidoreductase (luciferase family)
MKFGISLQNYGPTNLPDKMLRIAQAAEQGGFDSIWVSGHLEDILE